jgi:DNA-binding NtrC family response regulator
MLDGALKVELEQLEELAQQRGRPFKLLIVDDEQWVREVFQQFCKLSSVFEVELAPNGAEAVEKVKTDRYDLITLDIIMPEMSGLDALTAIKKLSPGVPVVVITGNATDKLVKQAGVNGACRVMYKPVALEEFLTGLAAILKR